MSTAPRRLAERRRPGVRPLEVMREFVARNGPPDDAGIRRLSGDTGLPEAAVRGIVSSYADLRDGPADLLVCRGTACELAGAAALHRRLGEGAICRAVRCVGHCHSSPAVLRRDGRVVVGPDASDAAAALRPGAPAPPAAHVRSMAGTAIVTRRLGARAARSLAAARRAGAWEALEAARAARPGDVLGEVERSGERGRGGAAFPTGRKWRTAAEAPAEARYVVANGDEGDPGSFVDRLLMEDDPHGVLEGLATCALAIGARQGVVFVRSEYPRALAAMRRAVVEARAAGFLGPEALGPGRDLEVEVVSGLGSYVCGEETALLNALEGLRCEVRPRPPFPAVAGLRGRPTVVNNIETLVAVPWIVAHGGGAYRALGTAATPGTKALCLSGGFARPGVVEVEFGNRLAEVVEEAGGGADGPIRAILVGGPMGSVVTADRLDVAICHEALRGHGIELGHGGLVAVPRRADPRALALHLLEFMVDESCGRCVPCAQGSLRALEAAREASPAAGRRLLATLEVIEQGSLCAFGHRIPVPVRELLELADGAT